MLHTPLSPNEYSTQEQLPQKHHKAQLNREKAQLNTIMGVINCYLREYAIPKEQLDWNYSSATLPQTLKTRYGAQQRIAIHLPHYAQKDALMVLAVEYISKLGKIKLSDTPWLKMPGAAWCKLDATQTLTLLLNYLKQKLMIPFNQELVEQMENSMLLTELFLNSDNLPEYHNAFITSEQSLLWGHAFHPTPKSRSGVSIDELLACSPEVGAKVILYWFKVDRSLLDVLSADYRATPHTMFEQLMANDSNPANTILYPCHPWESHTLLQNPVVKIAIQQGKITPLGLAGERLYPTSSVRTLYHPDTNWFAKFSINVRLTNCIRKNAWYELDSAVQLTSILQKIKVSEQLNNPIFKVMSEPYATTLNLESIAKQAHADVIKARESFGILYRESFTLSEIDILQPTLAGSLFAYDQDNKSCIATELKQKAQTTQSQYENVAKLWFERYLHCLLPGIFNYYFKHGVVFEPHLQNTLIGFEKDMPCCVWIRDLEGTKLLPEFWPPETLQKLSERARQSVYYSREQGWNRIAYCTFINNISEAIFFIAEENSALENTLWSALKKAIMCWQSLNTEQPELVKLLNDSYFPSKNNFTTRLLQHADKDTDYTQVAVPWPTHIKGVSHA